MKSFLVLLSKKQENFLNKELLNMRVDFLKNLYTNNKLLVSGPFTDNEGAILIINADSLAHAEEMIKEDPFIKQKYYKKYIIYEFMMASNTDQTKGNLRLIEVVKYNSMWPKIFQDEAAQIKEALGNNCLTIHHIGSTSVPGLSAKPIIDILPVVIDLKDVDGSNINMQKLGYEIKGEYGFMLRRFFIKKNAFHVHVFEQGNPEIDRHLKFRNWMIDHPEDRDAYASLKEKLAEKYFNDRTSYCFGKDEFVANIDEKAGWHGIRIVKALTENEWSTLKQYREKYFHGNVRKSDPYTDSFDDPSHVHLVVLKKTDIIGYAHIQLCSDEKAIIQFIFINEKNRKQNFGSELLIFIEKWLRSRNFKTLCSKTSSETFEFLKKYGFRDIQLNNIENDGKERFIGKQLSAD